MGGSSAQWGALGGCGDAPLGGTKEGPPSLLTPALWGMGGTEGVPFTLGSSLTGNPFSIETRGAPGASLPTPPSSVETPRGGTKGVPSPGHPPGSPLAPQPRGTVTCGAACTARWVTPGWLGAWLEGTGVGDAALALSGGETGGGEGGHPNSDSTGVLRWAQCPGRGRRRGSDHGVTSAVTVTHTPGGAASSPGRREDGTWGR